MSDLTPEQVLKKTRRQALHFARQNRMPADTRPRLSPRDNMPKEHHGVFRSEQVSCRVCVEHPERFPNDFRYLFRKVGAHNDPEFYWLDMEGVNRTGRVYPSLYAAIVPMVRQGWEDASW